MSPELQGGTIMLRRSIDEIPQKSDDNLLWGVKEITS
jgi:hypothetical protein